MTEALPAIAVLGGTGSEGWGLALRWAVAGYPVIIGSRSAERAREAAAAIETAAGEHIAPSALDFDRTELARRLALEKLAHVRDGLPGDFILAADTVVGVGRRILPKAENHQDAAHCLKLLSGRRHHVFTALAAAAPDGTQRVRLVDSVVAFKGLTASEINWYLDSDEWRGKAGGYAIQGRAGRFVRFLRGSYTNVVGLPLFETANLLEGLGYRVRGKD